MVVRDLALWGASLHPRFILFDFTVGEQIGSKGYLCGAVMLRSYAEAPTIGDTDILAHGADGV